MKRIDDLTIEEIIALFKAGILTADKVLELLEKDPYKGVTGSINCC